MPAVSVLMPVHNAAPYLAAALDSVLAQSFADFELLIVDDGSLDGSVEILRGYAARDPRIRLTCRENRGLVASLNELAAQAEAPYLARMDSDDICLPDRFGPQVAHLDANPDCAVVGGWALKIDGAGRPISPIKPPLDHDAIDAGNLSGRTSLVHPTVMIRKASFDAVGGYDARFIHTEDKELWLRLAETARLANLPRYMLRYRVHDTSISSRKQAEQYEISARASAEAAARRGVENPFHRVPYRPDDSRESQRDFALKYGWQAWKQGFRGTSRHYARRALGLDPLSWEAWKLLIFGALRPSPKTWEGPE